MGPPQFLETRNSQQKHLPSRSPKPPRAEIMTRLSHLCGVITALPQHGALIPEEAGLGT